MVVVAAEVEGAGPGTAARRRERGSSPACALSCSEPSLSESSCKGRVVPFELLVRYGVGGWEMGPSLSLSLAASKVGSKMFGKHVAIRGITTGLVYWVCST